MACWAPGTMLATCFTCNILDGKLHEGSDFCLYYSCGSPKSRSSAWHLKVNEWILKTTAGTIIRPILHRRKLMVTEVKDLTWNKYSKKGCIQIQAVDPSTLVLEPTPWITTLDFTVFLKKCIFWPIRRFGAGGQMAFGVMAQLVFNIWTLYDHE